MNARAPKERGHPSPPSICRQWLRARERDYSTRFGRHLDLVESERARGVAIGPALAEAVRMRTRPILLTSGTTVAGLMPLALSDTTLWPPLAWTMISGLGASTLLTLLVVPALYRVLFRGA